MTKQEFVNAIAADSGLSKADTEKALNAITETIKNTLAQGESVQLVGFGTFSISERAARTGRNPQTGKEIQIAAKKVAKFKPGKALDESIN
ncbi:HU family DNA-binding protein [Plebeiibacterium sediminum]|uniref:HU family DNA-binding protein n=1 Tax=Plebeiibacterium sediminum TaxID=2992112 RepID=A0AAE3SIW3_9BACT|nr:HU family DNA-binding protein [Plebeiobacterium sediminum]MCW3789693.1 HU family DNA-binding protein [Plebeiobacterium sediminum]